MVFEKIFKWCNTLVAFSVRDQLRRLGRFFCSRLRVPASMQ
jgi:hypothetical protein